MGCSYFVVRTPKVIRLKENCQVKVKRVEQRRPIL
ncbi:uncharacterized protein G2W53_006563 [Senna tora]|uniref:Uncharacterized protein n=1 Tax=Senna tora TaxID=362788 RepID=A0A835CE40_9FABA|nr:uncharacterized protein G2W53_006563 [Senna tora]